MVRCFHNIGQGAFYTEIFEDKNKLCSIYDCGSTAKKSINCAIDCFSSEIKSIDILFISHFHSDHINGIEHLLKCCAVKKMILPLLTEESIAISLVAHLLRGGAIGSWTYNFIESQGKNLSNSDGSPIDIIPVSEETQRNQDIQFSGINKEMNSGTEIIADAEWVYIPFNLKNDPGTSKLQNYLKNNAMPKDPSDTEKWWKKNKENIRSLYESFGDLNTNSLVLYSGPKHSKCGCLYMGDYNASGNGWKKIEKAYTSYLDNIHTIQIPHHGSRHNFNKDLIIPSAEKYIISAGKNNRHNHPHDEVKKHFLSKPHLLEIITECCTGLCQHIAFEPENNWYMIYPI